MTLTSRLFLIDSEDVLHRLPLRTYEWLLRSDDDVRLLQFAGQRVREASAVVEVEGRVVLGLRRLDFAMLEFDAKGRLDGSRYAAQQVARLDSMLAGRLNTAAVRPTLIDATDRFTARGGLWRPSPSLRQRIEATATGVASCRSVRVTRC